VGVETLLKDKNHDASLSSIMVFVFKSIELN